MHPIENLVRQHLPKERGLLDGSGCLVRPDLPWWDVDLAIAHCAAAPEHALGENPLAFFSLEEDYPGSFEGFLLVTDRRLVGRYPRLDGRHGDVNVRYAWLQGAKLESGMLTTKVVVQHAGQVVEMHYGTVVRAAPRVPPGRHRAPAGAARASPEPALLAERGGSHGRGAGGRRADAGRPAHALPPPVRPHGAREGRAAGRGRRRPRDAPRGPAPQRGVRPRRQRRLVDEPARDERSLERDGAGLPAAARPTRRGRCAP